MNLGGRMQQLYQAAHRRFGEMTAPNPNKPAQAQSPVAAQDPLGRAQAARMRSLANTRELMGRRTK
jgi:hypothetical protein